MSQVLRVVAVTEGDFIKRSNQASIFDSQIDQSSGQISASLAHANDELVTGTGSLAIVQFEVIGAKTTTQISVASGSATGAGDAALDVKSLAPVSVSVP